LAGLGDHWPISRAAHFEPVRPVGHFDDLDATLAKVTDECARSFLRGAMSPTFAMRVARAPSSRLQLAANPMAGPGETVFGCSPFWCRRVYR